MSALPITRCTPAEYLRMERQAEFKSEYDSGVIYAMSGASRAHNVISMNISASLAMQLRDRPCEVYANDMRVQAASGNRYSYPDIVAVCGEPEFLDVEFDTLLNPLVIVEVLSPSTEAKDRGEKFLRYRQTPSLTDYLLVSQDAYRIEHYTQQPDGAWRLNDVSDLAESVSLPSLGCTLTLADVYNKVTLDAPVRLTLEGPR